jgi:hypothetical protein
MMAKEANVDPISLQTAQVCRALRHTYTETAVIQDEDATAVTGLIRERHGFVLQRCEELGAWRDGHEGGPVG